MTPHFSTFGTLAALLLYHDEPTLSQGRINAAIHQTLTTTEYHQGPRGSMWFAHLDYLIPTANGKRDPLRTAVGQPHGWPTDDHPTPDLSQSRQVADAAAIVGGCKYSVQVDEMMGKRHDRGHRVKAFRTVVDAVIASCRPNAIWWPMSDRLTVPHYGGATSELEGFVNVRVFSLPGQNGRLVMDSLGLNVFGLPDIETTFHDIDPQDVSDLLHRTALDCFQNGVRNLSEATGEGAHFGWRLMEGDAYVPPGRPVLRFEAPSGHQ